MAGITYESFVKLGNENGVNDITKDEFSKHLEGKLWSPSRALVMVKNGRKKAVEDANKTIEVHIGYPLGGRDFVYKGITIEKAKSQLIPFLLPDGSILELTEFGSFKGKHLYQTEVEVEVSQKQGAERMYINHNIRGVRILEDKIDLKRLMKDAKQIGDITEDSKYEHIILLGKADHFDVEPTFEGGNKVGNYPLMYNGKPCFNISFRKNKLWVRASCAPQKHSEHVLEIPDLLEVFKTEDVMAITSAYKDEWFLVVGMVKRFDFSEQGEYINVDATAMFMLPENLKVFLDTQSPAVEETSKPAPQPMSDFNTPPKPNEPTIYTAPAPAALPKPANPSYDKEKAMKHIEELKAKIKEGREILGDDFTIQGLRDLGMVSTSVPDTIIQKIIDESK